MTDAPRAHRYRVTVTNGFGTFVTVVWACDASDARSVGSRQMGLRGTITAEVDEAEAVSA